MTRTLTLKDPADLRLHPLKKSQPKPAEWQKGGAAFNALVDDLRDRGFDHALLITPDGFILDGESRWLAAKQLRLTEVPVMETAADAASVILGTLLLRQHLTKSALAYLAYPLLKPAMEEAKSRHLARLRSGNKGTIVASGDSGQSVESFARRFGVERSMLFEAQKVHEHFVADTRKRTLTDKDGMTERDVTFREFFERRILRTENPYGLGAVCAGIGFILSMEKKGKHTGLHTMGEDKQMQLFVDAALGIPLKRWGYWAEADEEKQQRLWESICAQAERVEPETAEAMADFYSRLAKTLRSRAGRKEAA